MCAIVIWTGAAPAAAATTGSVSPCEGSDSAISLFNAGQQDAAYLLLSQLADRGCSEPVVYLYGGAYERGHGQRDRAVATFRRGLSHDAANVQLLLELAVTYSWTNRLSEARAAYQMAINLDPRSTPARLGEARVTGWMGRRDEAVAKFEAVLAEHPDNTEALAGLAAVHLAALRVDAARTYYRRVLALEPTNADAREGLLRADAVRRVEISTGVASDWSSVRPVQVLGLSASYQATPDVRLTSGYNAVTRDPILEQYDSQLRGTGVVASQVNLGIGWRVSPLSSVSAAYQAERTATGAARAVSFETSRLLTGGVALFGSMRSSASRAGGSLLLAATGVSFAPTAHTSMVVQGFYGVSRTGRPKTLAGTLGFPAWRGLTTGTTIGVSHEGSTAVTLSGAAAFRLNAHVGARIDGTVYQGRYTNRRLAMTLTARY
jgi:tetratricopeptide (TPR) repeat protein